MTKIAKGVFYAHPVFGYGEKKTFMLDYMDDNPYETLAKDGVIGMIVLYMPLLLLFRRSTREQKYGIIILMIGYLQRPLHTNYMQYIMVYIFVTTCLK